MLGATPGEQTLTAHSTLFRHEALDFQRSQRQWGEVALLQPLSTRLLSWSAAAAFVAVMAFACLTQYARKETVPGYLTPAAGTAKVFAANPGVVTEVYVREGDEVREGQPLLTIGTGQIAADGQDVNATVLAALTLQRGLLRQQIAAEEQRTGSERARLCRRTAEMNPRRSPMPSRRSSRARPVTAPKRHSGNVVRLHDRAQRRATLYKLATAGDWDAAIAFLERYGRWATLEERQAVLNATLAKYPPRPRRFV